MNYSDIYLIPNYSEIRSRDNVSTEVEFLGKKFKSPAIPANMACCIDFKLAELLSENEYFYILHRFYPYEQILDWVKNNQHLNTISISVGVKDKDKDLINDIMYYSYKIDYITIDVSSGHNILVKEMIAYIKQMRLYNSPKIIAGNVMTAQACINLRDWGADAIKVGIAGGSACGTASKTGVLSPMFSTIKTCSEIINIPIISDGGIREIGDICKSLVAGSSLCMVGSLFAQCKDSPAEIKEYDFGGDIEYKLYYGSASVKNKGYNKYIEGFEQTLPMKDQTYLEFLDEIEQGIRSCCSYGGYNSIKDLKKMKFGII